MVILAAPASRREGSDGLALGANASFALHRPDVTGQWANAVRAAFPQSV